MEKEKITVLLYQTVAGRVPTNEWLFSLDERTRQRVDARLARTRDGNLGDYKSLRGGLYELRFSFGPGFRVYFAREGPAIIILLCAGDKRSQRANIDAARRFYKDFQERKSG